jgi:hypothetical protein
MKLKEYLQQKASEDARKVEVSNDVGGHFEGPGDDDNDEVSAAERGCGTIESV